MVLKLNVIRVMKIEKINLFTFLIRVNTLFYYKLNQKYINVILENIFSDNELIRTINHKFYKK